MGGDTAGAARVYGLFGTVWALMQFVSMPVLGALSDRFGRRPVLLISMLGSAIDYFAMASVLLEITHKENGLCR